MSRTMPVQKPGKSETVVVTPQEFVHAAARHFGIVQFEIDLAATVKNTRCSSFITPKEDSLSVNWKRRITPGLGRWAWLNPPYDDIAPWVKKASESGRCIAVLVPASPGTNWWSDYVHEKAWVNFLNGRITFLDKHLKPICSPKTGKPTPYPKDLALLLYGLDPGYDIWRWK